MTPQVTARHLEPCPGPARSAVLRWPTPRGARIRLLRSADPRIADQMHDLAAYQPVRVLAATPYARLPGPAARRLGARPGQKNLLVRLGLRDLDKTLTNEAANGLRDRIYLAIHQGTQYQWAARRPPWGGNVMS